MYLADDTGIIGGYKGNWTVDWQELQNSNQIKFHVIEWPYTTDDMRQFEYISSLPENSKLISQPEII
jgi:hypothetical protein